MNAGTTIFVKKYLPGFKSGGPVRSVSNICEVLKGKSEFRVVCEDRDSGDRTSYPSISVNDWNTIDSASILYIDPSFWNHIKVIFSKRSTISSDTAYFNSFFNFKFTFFPLFCALLGIINFQRILISPRGELMEGAISSKSHKKKIMYLKVFKFFFRSLPIQYHATSKEEVNSIITNLGCELDSIVTIPNLPSMSIVDFVSDRTSDRSVKKLKLVYISRISPKKNLKYFLDNIVTSMDLIDKFDIYGFIDDSEYFEKLNIAKFNGKVNYKGVIDNKLVPNLLQNYDLFVLPTRGENFGHAICESLLCETPVIVSKFTPFYDVDIANAGYILDLDQPNSVSEIIETAYQDIIINKRDLYKNTKKYVINKLKISKTISDYTSLFK
ncbi:glycosyltransferase [Vibrio fluvialis]|nr:glycosyltransferase [Vibrio fluvialis]